MRIAILAVAVSLSVVGLAPAGPAQASIRRNVEIPAGTLDTALKSLARTQELHVMFVSEDVAKLRSPAIHGTLSTDEALAKMLDGTGLTYCYLSENTVSIVPADKSVLHTRSTQSDSTHGPGDYSRYSNIRVAQAAQAADIGSSAGPVASSSDTAGERSGTEEQSISLQEIVVTATKRGEEDLQSTPISITAFSQDSLRNLGLSNLSDISALTAGLDLQKTAPGRSQVIIRGVTLGSVGSGQPQNHATTGLYLNDVSFEQNGINPDPDLYDLERVEVLKGPQGSRFGSSAMAGAVRYVTKRPNLDTISGELVVGASKIFDGGSNSSDFKGVINLPIIEGTLGTRIMAYRTFNGGWIDNAVLDRTDINTVRTTGMRVSTLWRPADSFSAHLMAQYQYMDIGYPPRDKVGFSTIYGQLATSPDQFKTYTAEQESTVSKVLLTTLELNWDLKWATLTSVSGFVDNRYRDKRPGDLADFLLTSYGADLPDPQFTDPFKSAKVSQEVRLTQSSGATSGSTLGVYFSDTRNRYQTYMSERGLDQFLSDNFFSDPAEQGCLPQYPDHLFCGTQRNWEKQFAVFGEVDYHLFDKLTLTAGGRWFHYDQKFDERYGGFFNGGPTVKLNQFKESGFSPALSASYKMNDSLLLYTSAAKGFRMGGVDDPVPNVCDAELATLGLSNYTGVFKSDSLWTYEAGAKKTFGNNRATLDGAAFYTVWNNIQTGELLRCGYPITQNASQEKIKGVELSSRLALTSDLSLDVNGSYTHSYLVGDAPAIKGHAGDRAPYTPYVRLGSILNYQHALTNNVQGFALVSVSYQSDSYINYQREARLTAQVLGNLRFGIATGAYRMTLFVDNFTDQLVLNDSNRGYSGERNWSVGQPRTAGIELQADF